jgi:hypothetical protein
MQTVRGESRLQAMFRVWRLRAVSKGRNGKETTTSQKQTKANMKKLNKVIAVAAMLGLWSGAVYAQGLIYINLNLTASVQSEGTDVDGVTKTPAPEKFRISNSQILTRLETDHGTTYAKGARLAINTTNDEEFVVVDKTGAIVDTVPELSLSESDTKVFSGSSNDTTDAGTRTEMHVVTIFIDESADTATQTQPIVASASGVLTDKRSVSKPDKNNNQTESDRASGNVAGDGTIGGVPAIITGSISGSGRDTFVPES